MSDDLFDDLLFSTPARIVAAIESDMAPSLHECILFLAGRCDGARTEDGQGFNKWDAKRGHKLADLAFTAWSDWDRYWAWEILNKYRGQFERAGLRWDLVPQPQKPTKQEPKRELVLLPDGSLGLRWSGLTAPEHEGLKQLAGRIVNHVWYPNPELQIKVGIPADSESVKSLWEFLEEAPGFEYDEAVERRMLEAADRAKFLIELSRAVDWPEYDLGQAEITSVDGNTPLGSQRAGVYYLEQVGWQSFIGDQMGTGKTVLAILAGLKADARKWLIICPRGVREQWVDFLHRWVPDKKVVEFTSGHGRKIGKADIVVANYDLLRWEIIDRDAEGKPVYGPPNGALTLLAMADFDCIVVDEAQYLIHGDSMRSRAVGRLMLLNDPRVRLVMSGTLILNSMSEFAGNIVNAGLLKSFGTAINMRRQLTASGAKTLHGKLRENGLLCRMADHHAFSPDGKLLHVRDVPEKVAPPELTERFDDSERDARNIERLRRHMTLHGWELVPGVLRLPGQAYDTVPQELSDYGRYWYAEEKTREWLLELAEQSGGGYEAFARWMKAQVLVEMNKLRQLIAELKYRSGRRWVHEHLDTGEKLVLGIHHQHIAEKFEKDFPGCVRIRGSISKTERADAKQAFAHDPDTRLIVVHMEAGGIGLDGLQTSCAHIANFEYLWNPGKMDQFYGRVYRVGQTRRVVCHELVAKPGVKEDGSERKTIDQYFQSVVRDKRGVTSAALHGVDIPKGDDVIAEVVDAFMEDAA